VPPVIEHDDPGNLMTVAQQLAQFLGGRTVVSRELRVLERKRAALCAIVTRRKKIVFAFFDHAYAALKKSVARRRAQTRSALRNVNEADHSPIGRSHALSRAREAMLS